MRIRKTLTDILRELQEINANLQEIVKHALDQEPNPAMVETALNILQRVGRKNESIIFATEPAPVFEVGDAVWVQKKVGDALVNAPGRKGVVIARDTRTTLALPRKDFWTYRVEMADDTAVVHYGKPYPPHYEHLTLLARTPEVGDPVLVWAEPGRELHDELGNAEGVGWIASVNRDGDEWAVAWGWHRSFDRFKPGVPDEPQLRFQRRCSRYAGASRARIVPRGNHDRAPAAPPSSLLEDKPSMPWTNRFTDDWGDEPNRAPSNERTVEVFPLPGFVEHEHVLTEVIRKVQFDHRPLDGAPDALYRKAARAVLHELSDRNLLKGGIKDRG